MTVGLALFRRRWDWAFAVLVAALGYLAALYGTEELYGFWGAGD